MISTRRLGIVLGAVTTLALGVGVVTIGAATGNNAAQAAATAGGVKFAYYDQWSVYGNAFYPKNVDTSGIASKLDFLVYDFENIDPVNLTCFEATKAADSQNESDPNAGDGAGDAFADYQKSFGADISVDGVGDTWNQPIVGTFNQLKKLKARHPNLKIVFSLGGWTYSKFFSDAAATDASRKKLVSSCIDMFIKGNLPAQGGFGGPGTAAGIFDGVDIDWEYPGGNGHVGNHASPNDKQNFTLLLAEFRRQLDALGGGKKYLTAAVPSGQDKIKFIETDKVGQYLDYANVMTYDMHGGWEATGPTNHQAPLFESPGDPMTPVPPGTKKYSVDTSVTAWTTGLSAYGIPGGFPANKMTIGVPFYYRGWTGVQAGGNHGLYQPASGPAAARGLSQTAGVAYYKELTGIVDNASSTFWDPVSQTSYFYTGNEFWTGETKQSIKAKADYLHCKGLGGAMMFSLLDLDPATTLFNEVVNDVNGSAAGCPAPSPTPTGTTSPSPSPTGSPTGSPTPPGGSCSAPAWNSSTAYTGGMLVSYNGHTWKAKWWTQNETPGTAEVWVDQGACSGGGTTSPPAPGQCSLPAWSSTTAYVGGQQVSYGGHKWTAKWWTQGDVPGANSQNVWTDNGPC